jgi:hypothetical protein
MSNPYLDRLRGKIQEKPHPSLLSKPSKPSSEGFEGDHRRHFLENRYHDEGNDTAVKNSKITTTAYAQNLQNQPDGVGARLTIIAEGLRYRRVFAHLQVRPPAYVEEPRWRQAVEDGKRFLRQWGSQAQALNWSARDLFGLIEVPHSPAPNFNRLGRYDRLGLCWLLQNREVVALTEATATIRNPTTGVITTYRRHHKPPLGRLKT